MKFYEPAVAERKRRLFSGLQGRVLEIGPGTGVNFRHLPPGIDWIGVEPNPHMRPFLDRKAAEHGHQATVLEASAEEIPLDDASIDAVVGTLVLCSVPDVTRVLQEVKRVLKPGGEFRFIEHVRAPEGSFHAAWQRTVKPVWKVVACGCHCDRTPWEDLQRAGFAHLEFERFSLPFPVVRPHIAGRARR
jgi:ubiquinone/menaquinone biosynthesis C-methylase UbiE